MSTANLYRSECANVAAAELAKKMDNEKIFTDLQKSVSDLENQTEVF